MQVTYIIFFILVDIDILYRTLYQTVTSTVSQAYTYSNFFKIWLTQNKPFITLLHHLSVNKTFYHQIIYPLTQYATPFAL